MRVSKTYTHLDSGTWVAMAMITKEAMTAKGWSAICSLMPRPVGSKLQYSVRERLMHSSCSGFKMAKTSMAGGK